MKNRFFVPLLIVGALLVLFACSTMDSDTLATVGGKTITLKEFTSNNPVTRFADKDDDFIDSKVDDFVRKALFTQVAIEGGLADDQEIKDKKAKAERRQMLQYVYERAILDAVMSEEYLREMYDLSGKELHARHILIQVGGGPRSTSDRTKVDALAIMGQINSRLSKGEDFSVLANEFTEDPSGKENGGDLGWFGWGKMVGPFQAAVFALEPGEISDVVETTFGFHIIKLEAKRDVKRGSFEEEKAALKNQARKEKGQELNVRANEFLEGQKKDAGFKLLSENVHAFFMIYDKSTVKQLAMDEVFKKLSYKAPLFEFKGKQQVGSNLILIIGFNFIEFDAKSLGSFV